MAGRLLLPLLRLDRSPANGEDQVDVNILWSADIGDRGHDPPPDPHTVVDVVRGDLVHHVAEEPDVRAGVCSGCWDSGPTRPRGPGCRSFAGAMGRPDGDMLSSVVELKCS